MLSLGRARGAASMQGFNNHVFGGRGGGRFINAEFRLVVGVWVCRAWGAVFLLGRGRFIDAGFGLARRAWRRCGFIFSNPQCLFAAAEIWPPDWAKIHVCGGVRRGWGSLIFPGARVTVLRLVTRAIIPMSAMMYCLWACGRMVCVMVTAL